MTMENDLVERLSRENERLHLLLETAIQMSTTASETALEQKSRAERAEAELARKTEALPDLSSVISWLENGCDPKNGAKELRIYAARIAAAFEEKTNV